LVCFTVMWLFVSADYFHVHPSGQSLDVASTTTSDPLGFVVSLLARRLACCYSERLGVKPSFGGFGDPALTLRPARRDVRRSTL
jgi:hypothetical protein